jgi:hypothetical protein
MTSASLLRPRASGRAVRGLFCSLTQSRAADCRRIRLDLWVNAGKYRFNGGVVPYQGSHVPFLHSQVGDLPTREE